jgi:uncharacterized protein
MDIIHSLHPWQWAVGVGCALMVGFSKTGMPGLGILFVPLFALVLPARVSTGALLPLLMVGDVVAVLWYHRTALWSHLWRLLPWAGAGIVAGFLLLGRVDDRTLRPVLGALIVVMLCLSLWRERPWENPAARTRPQPAIPSAWWFAALLGLLAGTTTMLANAAGPIMLVYLLAMRLPKEEFLGTGAWFYAVVNAVKVPFSASLGLITPGSLLLDAALAAGVLAGAALGILTARKIPERGFSFGVQILALASAVLLFF